MAEDSARADGKYIEKMALMVEESSLGSAGARQLRDRTPSHITAAIRARAYFAEHERSWWEDNQRNPEALYAKARELTAERDGREICRVLLRLAVHYGHAAARRELGLPEENTDPHPRQIATGDTAPQPADGGDWRSFQAFYNTHIESLSCTFCSTTGLPMPLARESIHKAFAKAFDDWDRIGRLPSPEEWVIGSALSDHRDLREPENEPLQPAACRPVDDTSLDRTSGVAEPSQREVTVQMTGALAIAGNVHPGATLARLTTGEATATVAWDVDQAAAALHRAHYRALVRLAALLVRDVETAEEVVQDAFLAMHGAWRRLRDPDKALSYLRQSVVNRSRAVLRHRSVVEKYAPKVSRDAPSAENEAITDLERSAVVKALSGLPTRQREALVLRYYGDLSEAEVAQTMGISRGAVKSHIARGMAALGSTLEQLT
jgi:RNA polymerase sigma-70 factor (sigma-E family)